MSARKLSPRRPRLCGRCKTRIAEQRPVYLLATTDGAILGPFHADCASRLVETAKRNGGEEWRAQAEQFGALFRPREETLPW
jgi:hypothetical protein